MSHTLISYSKLCFKLTTQMHDSLREITIKEKKEGVKFDLMIIMQ